MALGGQAGYPGLKISQPTMRLHQRLGYFLGIILLQQMLKVRIWHRRKATGRVSPAILVPNLLSILLLFPVPTHQPRVPVLGTWEGALWDQPQPAPTPQGCLSPSPPLGLAGGATSSPSPVRGSEVLSRERPLSQSWCCDPERRADGRVRLDATQGQTWQVTLHRHPQ